MAEKNNYMAITFSGDVYLHCPKEFAISIQRRSGGCIRQHDEPIEDLKEAYIKTVSTFHTMVEVNEHLPSFMEAISQ